MKQFIKSGFYDDPFILDDILTFITAEGPRTLSSAIDLCPVGDGNGYRDLSAQAFVRAFSGDIDVDIMRTEFGIAGGRGDIELPFHIHALDRRPILRDWRRRFSVSSILVEVKNQRATGSPDHVRQVESDVRVSPLGKVGFLVCRAGLSRPAKRRLSEINKQQQMLILPLDHAEVRELCDLSGPDVDEFFHRKELEQLQAAC